MLLVNWLCRGSLLASVALATALAQEPQAKPDVAKLRAAAETGAAEAQYQLGLCYLNGNGVQPDANEARLWFERAGEQSQEAAQLQLALSTWTGAGTPKDLVEAYLWADRAARKGSTVSELAGQRQAWIVREMTEAQREAGKKRVAQLLAAGKVDATHGDGKADGKATPAALAKSRLEDARAFLGGALFDVKDGEVFTESAGYRRLLEHVVAHGDLAKAWPKAAKFDRASLMRDPDALRGEVVVLRGVVPATARADGIWAVKLDQPVGELTDVWRMVVIDEATGDGVLVDMMQRPDKVDFRNDTVEVTGVFYRTVGFVPVNTKAAKKRMAPYLLATSLRVANGK